MDEELRSTAQNKSSLSAFDCMEKIDSLSEEELQQFFSDPDLRHDMSLLSAVRQSVLRHRYPSPDVEEMWQRFEAHNIMPLREKRKNRIRVISSALLSAAAVLALVFFLNKNSVQNNEIESSTPLMAFTRDTTPQVIRLVDEQGNEQVLDEIQSENGGRVNDMVADFSSSSLNMKGEAKGLKGIGASSVLETVGWKTISTPRGKVYKVILPDKTQVLMNADSRLTFPDRFDGAERVVRLVGEAFFTVTKDIHHPFIVESEKIRTHVLGTEFNLRAYPNSNPHVTLVSGQVKVDNLQNNQSLMMKPGQDVTINGKSSFDVSSVDTEYYVQWKEGFFYFDNVPLVEVLKELGRWYNVDIQITDNSLMSYRLHFIADRGASIAQVVDNLNGFSYLKVVREREKLVVSKKTSVN